MKPDTTELASVETMEIRREIVIDAPPEVCFDALLDELGPECQVQEGKPMPMKLEAWPGGRWYRDLGNNAGHFWGHVQVIKPPALIELCGPMPMSYPAVNHLQYRLRAEGGRTRVMLLHRAMGLIPPEQRDGMPAGWEHTLKRVRELADRRVRGKK
jgi:uncharacterized protein YndB with AHSA1/START domain